LTEVVFVVVNYSPSPANVRIAGKEGILKLLLHCCNSVSAC
jgi:hypothetical protein